MNIRRKIYEHILDSENQGGLPTPAEIRSFFAGMTDDVDLHLAALEREGLIRVDSARVSSIPSFAPVPQIGILHNPSKSGSPKNYRIYQGYLAFDSRPLGIPMDAGMHAIQICDDSMIDAGIEEGDLVILQSKVPVSGDIVELELDGQAVLRRYLVISGIPHFLAENSHHPELRPGWEFPMRGVFWALLRMNSRDYQRIHLSPREPVSYATPTRTCSEKAAKLAGPPTGSEGISSTPKKLKTRAAKAKYSENALQPANTKWPEPPSGIQLNETEGHFRTVETPGIYDTWGPRR